MIEMAARGVPLELDGAFQYVFKGIDQVADEIRVGEISSTVGRGAR